MSKHATIAAADPRPAPPARRKLRKNVDPAYTLRLLRDAIGLSQVEVAERSGIDQAELSRLERRVDARVSTLERYASALGLTLEIRLRSPDGHNYRLALEGPREEP